MAKILIIDDDPDFVLAVRMPLEAAGFEVEEAATTEEGIKKVLGVQPDLVILDVMMPTGYEGFETARAIREEHGLKELPIVMLTSLHEKRKVPYRFAPDETYLPVDVFLDKPIEPDALVDTINELLGERREEPKHPL
ncbi:MAG: PleD family two-component system response regulator [Anaerolineae bacterium]|jgi:CheY-like chemotaxis protein